MGLKTAYLRERGGAFVLCYQNFEGKQVRKSVGKDARIAQKLLARANDLLVEGKDPFAVFEREREITMKAMTLEEFFPEFFKRHGRKQSENTRDYYEQRMACISKHKIARIPMMDLTHAMIYKFQDDRIEEGASNSTINRDIQVISSMLTKAKDWGHIPAHPLEKIKKLDEPKPYKVRIKPDVLGKLLGSLSPTVALIVEFAMYTGLRKENILSLKIDQVDWDYNVVRVVQKGGDYEEFPLSSSARGVLKEAIGDRTDGYVFATRKGNRYNRSLETFERRVKELDIRTGNGKKLRFHDLRHLYGTWLRQQGVSLDDIALLMGHKKSSTTKRYAFLDAMDVAGMPEVIQRIKRIEPENEPKDKQKGGRRNLSV